MAFSLIFTLQLTENLWKKIKKSLKRWIILLISKEIDLPLDKMRFSFKKVKNLRRYLSKSHQKNK